MQSYKKTILSLVGLAALGGCQVFDPALYPDADPGEPHLDLANSCSDDNLPMAGAYDDHMHASLQDFDNNMSGFPTCGQDVLAGPDGFMQIDANAGDRWHIEATPEDADMDVALYLLSRCDALSCFLMMDRCGPGFPEDFTFVAENAGTYFLGIDNHDGGAQSQDLEMLVVRTQCGDDVLDHGEACEDGNLTSGDGCDDKCRTELSGSTVREEEPNNWHTESNVVLPTGVGTMRVTGRLGGPCDVDHYAMKVPHNASVYAIMLNGAGVSCDQSFPNVRMMFMDPSTGTLRGTGSTGGSGGNCPSIETGYVFNETLVAGEYHLLVNALGAPPSFDYLLEFNIVPGL